MTRVEQAARNNATWCDLVCRAHGVPGEFHASLWLNRGKVPRFYPNAVTLSAGGGAEQLRHLRELPTLRHEAAVKDSFATLDLAPLGLRRLFAATWLWRGSEPGPREDTKDVRWSLVQEPGELEEWEKSWSGAIDETAPRVFLPGLLGEPDVVFIAAHRADAIVAGAAANRTGEIVGLSNVFTPDAEALAFWRGCIAMTARAFPGLPMVAYERDRELAVARGVGFEPLGSLRVWRRPAA